VTNVQYPFASNYFDVSTENSSWTLKNTATLAVLGTLRSIRRGATSTRSSQSPTPLPARRS
jgi:hypothetical protein